MTERQKAKKFTEMSVEDVAALFDVTGRQVRNWIKDKGLPAKAASRGRVLDWHEALAWFVRFCASEVGNGGNSDHDEPQEDYREALARKVRAEADLMELKLAKERGQVAAVADVEKVLAAANSSIRTQIQAFPAQLAPQLVGMDDRAKIFSLLQRVCNQLLGNMARIDEVLEAGNIAGESSE